MDYINAVKQAEKGKKIRRKGWSSWFSTCWNPFGIFPWRLGFYGMFPDAPSQYVNLLATDWEAF